MRQIGILTPLLLSIVALPSLFTNGGASVPNKVDSGVFALKVSARLFLKSQ